ncbi:MAG: hypothetical protein CMJ84_01150 [Planctomycetes bacterium]|jgi:hypothetical protein|nr:hypothetical protein [Planctomycetota bacterium]MDP6408318.1 HEAT repeat domain-containing protein [Planctomycetota bacterium]
MNHRRLPLLSAALLCAVWAPASIEWSEGFDTALSRARSESRVLFISVTSDGEARSEEAIELYGERAVVAQAEHTINLAACNAEHKAKGECPRFEGTDCSSHRRNLGSATDAVLVANSQGEVPVPQHLWIAPDGKVLINVPWEITAEELVWCFVTARRRAGEDGVEMPEDARPPRRLQLGAVWAPWEEARLARGLTQDELSEHLKRMKSSMEYSEALLADWSRVLFTDEEDAVKYARVQFGALEYLGVDTVVTTLTGIGMNSPRSFWEVLEYFTKNGNVRIRNTAAVAMEELAAPDARKAVISALKKEKDPAVEKNWLRAAGACGRDDSSTRKLLLKSATREKDALLRRNALISLGYLAPHKSIRAALADALEGDDADDRLAAACAMALTRDAAYLPRLEEAVAAADAGQRADLEPALAVLEGANLRRIAEVFGRVSGDETIRIRLFFGEIVPDRADEGPEGEDD